MFRMSILYKMIKSDKSGGVLIMFALLLPILIMLVGAVVDFGAAVTVRTQMQAASDAAVTSTVSDLRTEFSAQEEAARRYFRVNYEENDVGGFWGVDISDDDIVVNRDANGIFNVDVAKEYTTLLLPVAQKDSIPTVAQSSIATSLARKDMDIILILDKSKSMLWDDAGNEGVPFASSRMFQLNQTVANFINDNIDISNPNVRMGIVYFSADSTVVKQLSNDANYLTHNIPPEGETCGACGIREALTILDGDVPAHTPRSDGNNFSVQKIVIFMSDGELNIGLNPPLAYSNWAEYLKFALQVDNAATWTEYYTRVINDTISMITSLHEIPDIRVYSIFLAGGSELVKKIATLDENGNPLYFSTSSSAEVASIFSQISEQLEKLRMVR